MLQVANSSVHHSLNNWTTLLTISVLCLFPPFSLFLCLNCILCSRGCDVVRLSFTQVLVDHKKKVLAEEEKLALHLTKSLFLSLITKLTVFSKVACLSQKLLYQVREDNVFLTINASLKTSFSNLLPVTTSGLFTPQKKMYSFFSGQMRSSRIVFSLHLRRNENCFLTDVVI